MINFKTLSIMFIFTLLNLFASSQINVNFHDLKYNYLDRVETGTTGEIILSADKSKAFVSSYGYGFYIVDITDKNNLKILSNYTYSTESSGLSAWGVSLSNDEKYVFLANIDGRLDIVDINDSTSPKYLSSIDLNNSYPRSVTVNKDNTIAYVPAGWNGGLKIVDISDEQNLSLLSSYDTGGDAQHIVLSDDEKTGYLSANTGGVMIFDLSDPSSPKLINTIALTGYTYWSELSPDGNTLFVGGSNGLNIVDVTDQNNTSILSTVELLDDNIRVQGLDISSDMTKAYLAAKSGGIIVVNISDLTDPKVLETYNLRQTESVKIAQPGLLFVGDNKDGLIALDVATANPNKTLAEHTFGNSLYTSKTSFFDNNTKLFTISNSSASETNYLTLLDISDLDNITELSSFTGIDEPSDFKIFDNGTKIVVADGFGADSLAENDTDGIKILDISDINNISVLNTFNETNGYIQGVEVTADNKTLITNERFKGIGIYDITNISSPQLLSSLYDVNNTSGYVWQNLNNYLTWVNDMKLSKDEQYLFVADSYTGLTILDISTLSDPKIKGVYYKNSGARTIEVNDDETLAFIGTSNGQVDIYDISDLANPSFISSIENFDYSINDIKISKDKNKIYVLESGKSMVIVDIQDPASAKIIGNTAMSSYNYDLTLNSLENTAFISNGFDGLKVIDITPNIYLEENLSSSLDFDINNTLQNDITLSLNITDTSVIQTGTYNTTYSSSEYENNISIDLNLLKTGYTPLTITVADENSTFSKNIYLHSVVYSTQNIAIAKGWNLVSLPTDTTISYDELAFSLPNANTVWKYTNKWEAYGNDTIQTTLTAAGIDKLTSLTKEEGFWINSSATDSLEVSGSAYDITSSATLSSASSGWHLVGTGTTTSVSNITTKNSNILTIWVYDNGWSAYSPDNTTQTTLTNAGIDNLSQVSQAQGFWIYVK